PSCAFTAVSRPRNPSRPRRRLRRPSRLAEQSGAAAREVFMTGDAKITHKGLRAAEMVQSGQGQEAAIQRAPGVWESRGIGNSYLVTTPEGDVLVNAGALRDARRGRELFAKVSQNPIRYIVLTQSHANQFGGIEVYKTPDNQVIAQRTY